MQCRQFNPWVRLLGQEDPLEKETATHSSFLAWEIHGQRSLLGYSPSGHRVRCYLATEHTYKKSYILCVQIGCDKQKYSHASGKSRGREFCCREIKRSHGIWKNYRASCENSENTEKHSASEILSWCGAFLFALFYHSFNLYITAMATSHPILPSIA